MNIKIALFSLERFQKIFLVFASVVFLCGSAQAQLNTDPADYSRKFIIASKNLDSQSFAVAKTTLESNKFITVRLGCLKRKRIIVEVRADYPKRIEEIEEELLQIVRQNSNLGKVIIDKATSVAELSVSCN